MSQGGSIRCQVCGKAKPHQAFIIRTGGYTCSDCYTGLTAATQQALDELAALYPLVFARLLREAKQRHGVPDPPPTAPWPPPPWNVSPL